MYLLLACIKDYKYSSSLLPRKSQIKLSIPTKVPLLNVKQLFLKQNDKSIYFLISMSQRRRFIPPWSQPWRVNHTGTKSRPKTYSGPVIALRSRRKALGLHHSSSINGKTECTVISAVTWDDWRYAQSDTNMPTCKFYNTIFYHRTIDDRSIWYKYNIIRIVYAAQVRPSCP